MKNSFFYEDGQNNIYNENGQLTYDPMEDVMSTIDDPTIVLETLRTTFIDRMIELPVGQRYAAVVGRELEEHKAYVLDLVDDDPQVTVCDVVERLTKSFEDFSLTKSAIHKHMNETCNLSVKKPHESEKRNSPENLQERYEWFMKWKDSDADFTKNCIFIDESGFHINMRKNYAWSRKSERIVVKLPQTRAASHTIIGAISTKGIIHIALRKPPPKGTTSAHYTKFINEPLDILDDMEGMKGSYLVMGNYSIHGSKLMQNKILRRGYKLVYLPIYSPELNAIKQFWSLVKGKMTRNKLLQSETMSSRIKDACEQVLLSDLYGFANHSKCQISKYYDRIPF
ncbi:hypothetical protein G6F62_007891 [Rhizopus arrhizus]|uniref:Tc1-like transposase DDE domain-containing protein n=1 Tax=Rhizopus oryzae TaxID=64495 RepID=A0A9P6WZX4_RHIOR|nr:hypothetical protein G6F23_009406 [Rhizopus arrhizus]KAG0755925.1 hypothetical protein G6F24_011505 [Rhizopus arrhizus]KAG0781906.1 hypothetical protein G6F21_011400 [Rhizopus arrhizus]KAG0784042.1 hypothetical protein G6F22_008453 [Rhizopus arrhizus]KAG0805885.1 hypothetical protein G6F20_011557 [Rhizopus arrhizus]